MLGSLRNLVLFGAFCVSIAHAADPGTEELMLDEDASDIEVLDQLAAAGSDLTRPHEVTFYIYCASQESNSAACRATEEQLGFTTTTGREEASGQHLCVATAYLSLSIQKLRELRPKLHRIAKGCEGRYDGWNAKVNR
jgi:hypothetical protein